MTSVSRWARRSNRSPVDGSAVDTEVDSCDRGFEVHADDGNGGLAGFLSMVEQAVAGDEVSSLPYGIAVWGSYREPAQRIRSPRTPVRPPGDNEHRTEQHGYSSRAWAVVECGDVRPKGTNRS